MTRNKTSLTSLGMGAQKAALAVLAKEGDYDMKRRIRLVPIITFGPFAFIPLLAIGGLLDYFAFNQQGVCLLVFGVIALLFYLYSLILSIITLKTEKKAQDKAYQILKDESLATDDELSKLKELFRLYNIQYINDIILALLELLYFILQILAATQGNSSSVKS